MTARAWHRHSLREPSGRVRRTSLGTDLRDSDVTGTVRREPGTRRLEARGIETRCENRRRVAAPSDLRIEERAPRVRIETLGGRPRWREPTAEKPERGATGKPVATFPRNALERRNPRGAASVRTANPRAIVTDSGGEQGPEVESVVRPHVAQATDAEYGQRQEGNGRREVSRLRPEGEASKGKTPGALPALNGRKDAGDETRQEGEKPCSRTRTGTRQPPGEWAPASACAEGAGTPGRRRAREGFGKPARSYSEGEANPRRGGARTS